MRRLFGRKEVDAGSNNLLSEHLSAPLNGTLECFEKQGRPAQSVSTDGARTTLTVKGNASGQPWFRFPWMACTGATEWQIPESRGRG